VVIAILLRAVRAGFIGATIATAMAVALLVWSAILASSAFSALKEIDNPVEDGLVAVVGAFQLLLALVVALIAVSLLLASLYASYPPTHPKRACWIGRSPESPTTTLFP